MKICFFIPSLGDGGAQRQCIALLNALQHNHALELHLILLAHGEHEDSLRTSRINVHRVEVRNFASLTALGFVVRTLRQVRPDVLISWLHPADIWSYAATRLVRGVPWVITERGSIYPDTVVFNLRKLLGRRAAALIVANSLAGEEVWRNLEPKSAVRMIPNMVIDPDLPQVILDRSTADQCIFVGRLEPEKNIEAVVAGFAQFATTHPHATLVVVGQGSQANNVARIARAKCVADRVELLGFRKDVPTLMSRARVLISLSHYEGMPNVVMEAIAIGLPAVVSDIPEHRALVGDDYPYYVSVGASAAECAEVISYAWTGARNHSDVYGHARSVLATMTPEVIAGEYIKVFTEVVTGTRSAKDSRSGGRQPGRGRGNRWPRSAQ